MYQYFFLRSFVMMWDTPSIRDLYSNVLEKILLFISKIFGLRL